MTASAKTPPPPLQGLEDKSGRGQGPEETYHPFFFFFFPNDLLRLHKLLKEVKHCICTVLFLFVWQALDLLFQITNSGLLDCERKLFLECILKVFKLKVLLNVVLAHPWPVKFSPHLLHNPPRNVSHPAKNAMIFKFTLNGWRCVISVDILLKVHWLSSTMVIVAYLPFYLYSQVTVAVRS